MDPVCHTLAGAALAESGLKHRSAFGAITLLIGANLPDIDVLAYLGGPAADLGFRRGITHGVLAVALLPLLLTGAVVLFDRAMRRMRRAVLPSGVRPGQLLLLAFIAVFSHPVLDTLNTYGVRWLMPFTDRWYYGDVLFIVDPWVWLVLGTGLYLGRRRGRARDFRIDPARPVRVALAVAAAYIVAMAGSVSVAERIVQRDVRRRTGRPADAIMVAPVPVNPFVRRVVIRQGDSYRTAVFNWLRTPHLRHRGNQQIPRGPASHPAAVLARETPAGRRFSEWARFPIVRVDSGPAGSHLVHLVDLRYATRPGARFGSISIPVPAPASLAH